MKDKLKIAILTGRDSASTCLSISAITKLSQVQIKGILLDSQPKSFHRRLRSLRYNIRREGISYIFFRFWDFVVAYTEKLASLLVPGEEILKVYRSAFPKRVFSLRDLSERYNIPILKVNNLNSAMAADTLRSLDVDLGIVLGTRILKRHLFSIPKMGCINLHKGKVPEYRGMPPGFWELYDNQRSAGITVHFVDDGLDTGDIIGEDSVTIHPKETPETLRKKLDLSGSNLLARCLHDLANGRISRKPQLPSKHKPKTSPTRIQRRRLDERLGANNEKQNSFVYVMKTLFYFSIYYSGIFHLVRFIRKILGKSRASIILYHRINDLAEDELTTNLERFIEHLLILSKHYFLISTSDLVDKVKAGDKLPGNSVAIHFDDCYRDIYTEASRILSFFNIPSCCFISSGYIGTSRVFPHDQEKSPFPMENLSKDEVLSLTKSGFEVGAHTVNHVDLGTCTLEQSAYEVSQSKKDLEQILENTVTLFSYPYGRKKNIRPEVVNLIREAGYKGLFSAYGGYIDKRSDPYNLRRIGGSRNFRAIDLLMEIEGLSFGAIRRQLKERLGCNE